MTTHRSTPTPGRDRATRPHITVPGRALGVFAAALLFLAPSPARAGLVLNMIVADSSATPGSAGGFDVILENAPNSTQDVTVGGFNFDILLANTDLVTLKGIDSNTASTYIFASTGSFGFLGNVLGGGIEVTGNDLAIPPLNGVTLSPGQSFGLAHVSYQVAANAVGGTVPVPLVAIGSGTALSDENGGSIADFSTRAGAISILAPVPEPSSMLLFAIGLAVILLSIRRMQTSHFVAFSRGY
jgi:hypothetical protein